MGELAMSHGRRRGSASPWRSPFRPSFARSEPANSFPESPCCSTTISPPPRPSERRHRPSAPVETPPPPSLGSNRPRERLHLAPTEPPSPATSAQGRRRAAAPVQTAAVRTAPWSRCLRALPRAPRSPKGAVRTPLPFPQLSPRIKIIKMQTEMFWNL